MLCLSPWAGLCFREYLGIPLWKPNCLELSHYHSSLNWLMRAGKEVVTVDTSGQTDESWKKLKGALEGSDVWKEMLARVEADLETILQNQSPEADAEQKVEGKVGFIS